MATPEQVAELRKLVDDTAMPYVFENTELSTYIDAAAGNLNSAAAQVWAVRASRYAGLVDVTEGASSRRNSQLYAQALAMSKHFGGGEVTATPTAVGRSGTRPIVRP